MGEIYKGALLVLITARHHLIFSQEDWNAVIAGCPSNNLPVGGKENKNTYLILSRSYLLARLMSMKPHPLWLDSH